MVHHDTSAAGMSVQSFHSWVGPTLCPCKWKFVNPRTHTYLRFHKERRCQAAMHMRAAPQQSHTMLVSWGPLKVLTKVGSRFWPGLSSAASRAALGVCPERDVTAGGGNKGLSNRLCWECVCSNVGLNGRQEAEWHEWPRTCSQRYYIILVLIQLLVGQWLLGADWPSLRPFRQSRSVTHQIWARVRTQLGQRGWQLWLCNVIQDSKWWWIDLRNVIQFHKQIECTY